MPPSPAGPDPPAWTCADVESWLKDAFRAMPFTPIYAPRGSTLATLGGEVPSATFDIVAFTGTVLGERAIERRVLLLWARCMATKASVGGSIADFCRETGMKRRRFDRMRERACRRVADAKNETDGR